MGDGRRWEGLAVSARDGRIAVFLAVAFVGLALCTRLCCTDPSGNSPFWPANAAIAVAMLVLPVQLRTVVLVACLGLNLAVNACFAFSPTDSLLYSVLNLGQGMLAALLMRGYCGAGIDLTRLRRLVTFGAIALSTSGIEAAAGEIVSDPGGSLSRLATDWMQWTLCDALGLMLALPAILLAVRSIAIRGSGRGLQIERAAVLLLIGALALAAFCCSRMPLYLFIYPLLVALAFRAGPAWVLGAVLLASVIASALTVHGYGPIAFLSPQGQLLREQILQPFLLSLFLTAVPANNALGEKMRTAVRLRRLQGNLEYSATHDSLTGLMNRWLFRRRVGGCVALGTGAVCLLDLDRFKQVNDTLGHSAGDELLRLVGDRLEILARETGLSVARFGGDEFALLVPGGQNAVPIGALCDRIGDVVAAPYQLQRGRAQVTASIGVAVIGAGGDDVDELIRKADVALYAAKAAGRNRNLLFDGVLDRASRDRRELESELRIALDTASGFSLRYQLKVGRDGRPGGVEALLRWHHPRLGEILPQRFIPIAEETGLILPLGNWVFREVVAFAARWPQIAIAVNMSPIQLQHPALASEILELLRTASIAPNQLELELTETALFEELQPVTRNLVALRAAGLGLALDDFGTGYSSLRHLHRLKVDRVKIDQTFVRGLGCGDEAAAIIQAIIQLGHAMGTQVTAEGVETEAQRDFLVRAGIDELQGYHFARPVEEARLAAEIARLGGSAIDPEPRPASILHIRPTLHQVTVDR